MKEIPLAGDEIAIVDDEDYESLITYKWYSKGGYAVRDDYSNGRNHKHTVYMHRYIVNAPENMQVDHINGDKFDNRKVNLRICTNHQNRFNCRKYKPRSTNGSKYKGVRKMVDENRSKPWQAYIRYEGKLIHLGMFSEEADAAKAYNEAAEKYFGVYAKLNDV